MHSFRAPLLSLTLAFLSLPLSAEELKVYFIGNSLTASSTLDRVYGLFKQKDINIQFGSQISGGKSLIRHLNYQSEPDQNWISWETNIPTGDTYTVDTNPYDGKPPPRFGLYDNALPNHQWDTVVFQTFAGVLNDDVEAIVAFINLTLTNNSDAEYYLYVPWPRRLRNQEATGQDDALLNFDYEAIWLNDAPLEKTRRVNISRQYSQALLSEVNKQFADSTAQLKLLSVGEVLFALDQKIRQGELPGIEALAQRKPELLPGLNSYTRLEHGINILYADNIHFNPIPHRSDALGIFIVGSTFFSVLSGQSPIGLSGESYGLDDTQDADLIRSIHETIWNTVQAMD